MALPRLGLPNALNQPLLEQICHAVRAGHRLACLVGLVDQEPVAELRVVAVGVEQGVGAVGLDQVGVGDRAEQPAVVGLACDLQYPTRHRLSVPG